jgi:hypothetical protein
MQLSTGAWIFIFSFIVWGVIFMGIYGMTSIGGGKSSKKEKGTKGKD